MDIFSGYNQIQIKPDDEHRTEFICPWGTFAYRKMPFGLKNAGSTFQWALTLIFHDLKSIIEVFLDDLAVHSRQRMRHSYHLRLVFERCHQFLGQVKSSQVHSLCEVWLLIRVHCLQRGYKRLRKYFNCLPQKTLDIFNFCQAWKMSYRDLS